jgi:2,3-bisphosphoglycerate-dependent phosphoglycerate mutase
VSAAAPRPSGVFDIAFLTDSTDVTEVILVRHGQQQIDDPLRGKVGDFIDPPLSELGRRQAQLVGSRFGDEHIDAVYASTLQRAYDTGFAIGVRHAITPTIIADLREVEVFRDVPPSESAVDYIGRDVLLAARDRMITEKRWDVYPLSESSLGFRTRVVTAIDGIVARHPRQRVVVACHGGVINAYIAGFIGVGSDMFFRPAHTAVNVVLAGTNGVRALRSLGDVNHLEHDADQLVTY